MTKHNFPNFIEWTYTKWYFWVVVALYSVWSGWENFISRSIGMFAGTLIAVTFIVSLFFFFSYIMARHNCKKLNHI